MSAPNVRIPSKPELKSKVGRTGSHPAVGLIRSRLVKDAPTDLAQLLHDLKSKGVIQDYSQCVLLLRSARNTPRFAKPYQDALDAKGIPVYNPRSRDYLEQPEVAACLGAFVRIVDHQLTHAGSLLSPPVSALVVRWVQCYDALALQYAQLASYVSRGAHAIESAGSDKTITPNLQTIIYRILAHEPFVTYQGTAEVDLRLSKLTRLFESFCSQYGRDLKTDVTNPGELPGWWYNRFYYGLCGYMTQRGLDDDEDEDVICPSDHFPIMTVHQAKGLE